ncbi:antifreeze protein [Crucibulum laeve]|uniref:Antifreeze protein n=1 Tax=Crucibulum laeve TaxID=68775 RepID=A0A5C3LEE8_9AGAR|nr:antifreeze protein [Crucibulum laeve]
MLCNSFLKVATVSLMAISSCTAIGPLPVFLGQAGSYVIFAKSGISTVPSSAITGDIGLSPAASPYLTGSSLTRSAGGTSASSVQVVGSLFAADFTSPTPSLLTTGANSMITAYNDAAGRSNPTSINLAAGAIGGLTFAPGLYKWTSGVSILSSITLTGTAVDTWIFQISGILITAPGVQVTLAGGALPKNIVWVVTDAVTLGSASKFNGVILAATSVTLSTGATLNGRILAQTAVALQNAVVTVNF